MSSKLNFNDASFIVEKLMRMAAEDYKKHYPSDSDLEVSQYQLGYLKSQLAQFMMMSPKVRADVEGIVKFKLSNR